MPNHLGPDSDPRARALAKLSSAVMPALPHPLDYEPLNAARRQLTLWSSILILWFVIGVDPGKLGPVGALKRGDLIPFLVGVMVVYQLYRWLLYWSDVLPRQSRGLPSVSRSKRRERDRFAAP